jgi:hypothetical protein
MTMTNRVSLPALLACFILLAITASTALAEPCLNAQARTESNVNPTTGQPYSTQLHACRAYELVSPPDTGGMPAILGNSVGAVGQPHLPGDGLQFAATPDGSVFFESSATPAGTGALPDGGYEDVFRSRRSSSGWVTRDMLPSAQAGSKLLEAVSADGSSALISTPITLSPEDVDNPLGKGTEGKDLYVVRDNGTPPEFVTHGEVPNRPAVGQANEGEFTAANADLSAVGFTTDQSLAKPILEELSTRGCYVWVNVESRLARLTNPNQPGTLSPPLNCRYFAVAADGRPIIADTSPDQGEGLIFATDPAELAGFGRSPSGSRRLSGNTPFAATFSAISPDDETVYITTTDQLVPNADSGADIYSVDLTKAGLSLGPPKEPALTCISCDARGKSKEPIVEEPNVGPAIYVGQSANGSHIFFTVAGTLYEHDSTGTRLIAPAADGLTNLVFSHNGQHIIATTSVALSASDTNGVPDIYELSENEGFAPQLITSGSSSTDGYGPVAVSDDGRQVLYEDRPNGAPSVIDEWVAGQTGQVSPASSTHSYTVLGTTGPELEDVFFAANEPLVPQDLNAGTTDIYDARLGGGFPAPTEPANNNQTPNPVGPSVPGYTGNLMAPNIQLPPLSPDTSNPASSPKAKQLSRAQKLAKSLKACRKDKSKSKRTKCEKEAGKKYGTKSKAKKSPSKKGGS